MTTIYCHSCKDYLNGTVQQDVTEISLKRPVKIIITASFLFFYFEVTSQEKCKTGFGTFLTIELNLPVELTKFCNRRA